MEPIVDIETRTASSEKLQDIVKAMRSMAALRIQQSQDAIGPAERFAETIQEAIASALSLSDSDVMVQTGTEPQRRAILLYCSEHGFVGNLNTVLLDHVAGLITPDTVLMVVGSRGKTAADERRFPVDWHVPMAAHPSGLVSLIQHVTRRLFELMADENVGRIDIVFPRFSPPSGIHPVHQNLLPLDPHRWKTRPKKAPPLCNLSPDLLLEDLIQEYFFAVLIRAAAESLSSVNRARFLNMGRAQRNIDEKLEELRETLKGRRQEAITDELLDLMSGVAAQQDRL